MTIRKARPEDAKPIAAILILAMEDILYNLLGENDYNTTKIVLENFLKQENNQYSYQNCYVVEEDFKIIAAANVYNGANLSKLRQPILDYIESHSKPKLQVENETQAGEIYIDSLGVSKNQQGKGIGSKLLSFLINKYVKNNKQTLGLLVDKENPEAKKLYIKLGFKTVGEKELLEHKLEHLQIK